MQRKGLLFLAIFYFFSLSYATTPYGISLGIVAKGQDPSHLHGYRTSFTYEPKTWAWTHVHIFFDMSYGHWWVSQNTQYKTLSIYSIAPVLRYFFKDYPNWQPFLDISIGPSYLTKTHLDDRNLGMHFAFQDQIGFGTALGHTKNLLLSISTIHYSNGSLCKMNAGISVPLMINLGYRW